MQRGTGFGSPLRARWSSRSSLKPLSPSFRTSPIRLAANVAFAGLLLANMVLAYRLLGEDGVAIDMVSGKPQQREGGTAFEKLRATLDNLSRSGIGVPLLTIGIANQADPSGTVEASSATFMTMSISSAR